MAQTKQLVAVGVVAVYVVFCSAFVLFPRFLFLLLLPVVLHCSGLMNPPPPYCVVFHAVLLLLSFVCLTDIELTG